MMQRIPRLLEWWREYNGRFVDIDEVYPFVTIHPSPDKARTKPCPILVGPLSLQSEVAGSIEPAVLVDRLISSSTTGGRSVIPDHRYVIENGEPLVTREHLVTDRVDVLYERLLLPIDIAAVEFVLTYSERRSVH